MLDITPVPSATAVPVDSEAALAPSPNRGREFGTVREAVVRRADLAFPDQVLPLSRLRALEAGTVEVPGVGELALTDWSRTQLARMLGIRWDRWFDESLVSPAERADELNRRLERQPGEWKIRSSRYAPDQSGFGAGVLRAFLGARYTPIDDARVFERLATVLGPRTAEFRFMRTSATDRTSQYVAVTEADSDLGVHGRRDIHRSGFILGNSEVGARAVSIEVYVLRLVCTNGLVVPESRVFSRVHRQSEDRSIDKDLAYAVSLLPERWTSGLAMLREAREEPVREPEQALWRLMGAAEPDVKRHAEAALAAFRAEPEPTRFGLIQAITRAARSLVPEQRLLVEQFAGSVAAARTLP